MDEQKVRAVWEWPVPCTVHVVRAFLGLAGYYRRFIQDYVSIVAPLTALLRKDAFHWSSEAETVFRTLQRALTATPVLHLLTSNEPFIVECDASGTGLNAVLHQGRGPIAFFSRQLAPRHTKLAAYERELIGLVQAVCHWRPYLWGRVFVVKTDHYSLKFLLDQRLSTIHQHQWASKLLGFDFTVEYKPRAANIVAGALSRRDTEETTELMALSAPSFHVFDILRQELSADPTLQQLKTEVTAGTHGEKWQLIDDLITVAGRIYMPSSSSQLQAALEGAHGMGHEGTEKTLHRLRADFHVPGARALVQEFVRACVVCQKNKTEHLHPAGLLQSLGVPSTVWSDVTMDFMEGLSRVNGNRSFLR
jgi:hypothetical protein